MTTTEAQSERQSAPATMRFGDLEISYDARVLTPRPWTAAQSLWAADLLAAAGPGPVLELCTGAGHIGLLAVAGTGRRLIAVDADAVACDYARRNAAAAGMADRVEVRHASLDEALADDEHFPLVVADPPWVPSADTGRHPADPLLAIDGGPDGLALARQCVQVARAHLAPEGVVLLQLGSPEQADRLADWVRDAVPDLVVEEVRRPHPTGVVVLLRRRPPEVTARTR